MTDYTLTADWWAEDGDPALDPPYWSAGLVLRGTGEVGDGLIEVRDPDCPSATGWLPGLILRENTAIDLMADLVRRQK